MAAVGMSGFNYEELEQKFDALRMAARDSSPVSGLTHQHYKYPARFSPVFVSAAIAAFSKPGDVVLDPYMGGGTTVVEALAHGRRAIGCDINELAVFVAKAKVAGLTRDEVEQVKLWALTCAQFTYHDSTDISELLCSERTRNLSVAHARPLKKIIALSLAACDAIDSKNARLVSRCVLLSTSQWALNGRKFAAPIDGFRKKLLERAFDMAEASARINRLRRKVQAPLVLHASAEDIHRCNPFSDGSTKANLIVTSPPYPGVHVLYHRWQVDGRKETPAPYWIAGCLDGQGSSYYNFGSRKQITLDDYFERSLLTLQSIRRVVDQGAYFVQLIAFAHPDQHLPRYLKNMEQAGFLEVRPNSNRRTWRLVPGRSWHAEMKGETHSAREVVLVHRAE